MVTIGEDYLAFIGCSYVSYDDNTQVDMPYLYRHIMVRKADGRIFAFGDNDLLDSLLGWSDTIQKVSMKVNADEYLIYGGPEMALACLKFDGNGLTVQEMSTNGIVGFPTTYINGNIYSVESPGSIRPEYVFQMAATIYLKMIISASRQFPAISCLMTAWGQSELPRLKIFGKKAYNYLQ